MTIVLVRHAPREHGGHPADDQNMPLSSAGRQEASALATKMAALGLRPGLCLTSRHLHAKQTAELLRDGTSNAAPVVELRGLTPHEDYDFEGIIREARDAGYDLTGESTVILVLHHPRLNQLVERLTSRAVSTTPKYAEAVCLTAASLADFVAGRAHEEFRLHPSD